MIPHILAGKRTASILCTSWNDIYSMQAMLMNSANAQALRNQEATRDKLTASALDKTAKEPKPGKAKRNLQRRSIAEREQIILAAFEVFSSVSYESASTRAIAERAGASHTKVLYHFGTKEKLWTAMMERAVGQYIDQIEADLGAIGDRSAGEALHFFIRDFVTFSARFPGVHRIMSMESTQGTSRLEWLLDRYLRQHFDTICNLIVMAQKEGSVRQVDPVRLYYHIIAAGASPFTLSGEYRALTGRDVFADSEVEQTIAFINSVIFNNESIP